MKKIIFASCALGLLAFASCKKDRTCECTSTDTAPGSTSSTVTATLIDASKGDAKRICASTSSTYTVSGTTYTKTNTCKLK
jgi:hypothetical protein